MKKLEKFQLKNVLGGSEDPATKCLKQAAQAAANAIANNAASNVSASTNGVSSSLAAGALIPSASSSLGFSVIISASTAVVTQKCSDAIGN